MYLLCRSQGHTPHSDQLASKTCRPQSVSKSTWQVRSSVFHRISPTHSADGTEIFLAQKLLRNKRSGVTICRHILYLVAGSYAWFRNCNTYSILMYISIVKLYHFKFCMQQVMPIIGRICMEECKVSGANYSGAMLAVKTLPWCEFVTFLLFSLLLYK